jgi:hypothetical protein
VRATVLWHRDKRRLAANCCEKPSIPARFRPGIVIDSKWRRIKDAAVQKKPADRLPERRP